MVFHFPCLDGLTAAWLAARSIAPAPALVPFAHGEPPPEVAGFATVFVLDVSFSPETLRAWGGVNGRVILLDHHVSAERALAGSGLLCPLDLTLRRVCDPSFRGVSASLDMSRSGAGLAALAAAAYGMAEVVPDVVWDVEDRDLWRWTIPSSREVCETLRVGVDGMDAFRAFVEMDRLVGAGRDALVSAGSELVAERARRVVELVSGVFFTRVAGFEVPCVDVGSSGLGSDVGAELLARFPEAPFAAFVSSSSPLRVGLRSEDGRVDVSEVAAALGGGGHRNAAGFSCRSFDDVAEVSRGGV